jgi:hypothetical protein
LCQVHREAGEEGSQGEDDQREPHASGEHNPAPRHSCVTVLFTALSHGCWCMLNVQSHTRLLAVLVLLSMILLTLMRCQAPSSVSRSNTGVFIRSSVPRDTPILPQTSSSNCYENRNELLDLHDLRRMSEGKLNLLNTMLRQSLFQQAAAIICTIPHISSLLSLVKSYLSMCSKSHKVVPVKW